MYILLRQRSVGSFLLIFVFVVKRLTGIMKLADSGSLKDGGTFTPRSFSFGDLLVLKLICVQRWTRGTLGGCVGWGWEGCCVSVPTCRNICLFTETHVQILLHRLMTDTEGYTRRKTHTLSHTHNVIQSTQISFNLKNFNFSSKSKPRCWCLLLVYALSEDNIIRD